MGAVWAAVPYERSNKHRGAEKGAGVYWVDLYSIVVALGGKRSEFWVYGQFIAQESSEFQHVLLIWESWSTLARKHVFDSRIIGVLMLPNGFSCRRKMEHSDAQILTHLPGCSSTFKYQTLSLDRSRTPEKSSSPSGL
jgi:hypothetical protein